MRKCSLRWPQDDKHILSGRVCTTRKAQQSTAINSKQQQATASNSNSSLSGRTEIEWGKSLTEKATARTSNKQRNGNKNERTTATQTMRTTGRGGERSRACSVSFFTSPCCLLVLAVSCSVSDFHPHFDLRSPRELVASATSISVALKHFE